MHLRFRRGASFTVVPMAKKVLVVDDSRFARLLVREALAGAGYEVIEADDGVTGETTIAANPDVSLVLCDVNMPRKDGLHMMQSVLASPGSTPPPFVMLTTESGPDLVGRARKAGAIAWIVKPFKPELLLAAVKKLVGDA